MPFPLVCMYNVEYNEKNDSKSIIIKNKNNYILLSKKKKKLKKIKTNG